MWHACTGAALDGSSENPQSSSPCHAGGHGRKAAASALTNLDYLDQSASVLKVAQMSLENLRKLFKSFAEESQTYMSKSLLKEHIIQRKLAEYLRLVIF